MGLNQTSNQSQKDFQIGSVAAFYSIDEGNSFVNVGVGDSFAYTEEITPLDANPDNGQTPDLLEGAAAQIVTVTGNLWEFKLDKINAIRGGLDNYENQASAPVVGFSQVAGEGNWEFQKGILLTGQNQDGTAPSITSVTGSVDGPGAADDFTLVKTASGEWALVPLDGTNFATEAQDLTIVYDYTPGNVEILKTGGKSKINRIWWRFINRVADVADAADAAANAGISEGDEIFRRTTYDFYYCTVNAGNNATFTNKDDTAPQVPYALSLQGKTNPTRLVGDQLMRITKIIELQSGVTL